jgi:methionyl-tRNA formyltransferase
MMRLVMLGTGPFAIPTLHALAASVHDVLLVVTRPPQGRRPEASPLQRAAESRSLPVWSPPTVNDPDAQARLKALAADLLVVCDYGEILRPDTLAASRLGGINLHGSLLPKFRGAAPVQWAILSGETETGNTVIQMTPGLDAGPCLGQLRTPIDSEEDGGQLESRLAEMGAELVLQIIEEIETGTARPTKQDFHLASKAPRLKKEHGAIDWSRSALEIKNQVRALRPWPRAYTFWHRPDGEALRLNIDRVAITSTVTESLPAAEPGTAPIAAPGTVLDSTNRLLITTGSETLEIVELQPAGKRSMPAADFLRGHHVRPGERFGPA